MKKEDNLPIEYINDEIEKYNNNVDELINLLHIQVDKYGLPQPSFSKVINLKSIIKTNVLLKCI